MTRRHDGWSEASARRVAAQTAEALGLCAMAGDIELVRLGTNGIFFADDAVIRVSPPDESLELVQDQLVFASWLIECGFPTSAPLVDRPQLVDGSVVTLWSRIRGEEGRFADRFAFGRLIRRFHELTNDYHGPLPVWEPLGRMGERLDTVDLDAAFTEDDRQVLCRWRNTLVKDARHLTWRLAPGPLHGDVHTGNVIVAGTDQYLIDFDRIARGPREWDLTQQVAALTRFGGDKADLDRFFEGYGGDLRDWPGADALVRLRLLFMTSWLLTVPRAPQVQAEIANRMHYWRSPSPEAPRWNPV